jgi:hypothetical protein
MPRSRAFLSATLLVACALACGTSDESGADLGDVGANDALVEAERTFQREYSATPIAVRGRVIARDGTPVPGAPVELADAQIETDADGRFEFRDVPRKNAALVVRADGFRVERIPLHLMLALHEAELAVPPVLLFPAGDVRLLFGGDVQLGRRYVDTAEDNAPTEFPPDDPDALITATDPEPGTRAITSFLRPRLLDADFVSANLETVVTDTPSTPDTDNTFLFFTLPGSIPALSWAGIDYVSLGNNHIYDYLDDGLRDTLDALDAHGMPHSGAGLDVEEAFRAHRRDIGEHPYAFLSMVSIEGIPFRNQTGATETRSGAADLNDDERIRAAIDREREAGYVPIAALHTGYEYTESPPDAYTLERMNFVAASGAALVVSHHPHVPQGFHYHDGILVAESLGNLIFDQERIETLFGLVFSVDMRGEQVLNAEARGVFIEDFVPKELAGYAQDHFERRIATPTNPESALVVPYDGGVFVAEPGSDFDFVVEERELELDVAVGDEGFGVMDLRPELLPGESLAAITAASASALSARAGRDLLVFGDMEDGDVDDEVMEPSIWYTTGLDRAVSSYPCQLHVYRGAVALCSIRTARSTTEATISIRNRVRVLGDKLNLPEKDLTLLAYASGDNAGPVRVEVTYHASFGEKDFGSEEPARLSGGSYPYRPILEDLAMPADLPEFPRNPEDPYDPVLRTENPRSFRVFFHHAAPERGAGVFRVDDVAVITWQHAIELDGTELVTPNVHDFVRVEGEPGDHTLSVKLRRLVPRVAVD